MPRGGLALEKHPTVRWQSPGSAPAPCPQGPSPREDGASPGRHKTCSGKDHPTAINRPGTSSAGSGVGFVPATAAPRPPHGPGQARRPRLGLAVCEAPSPPTFFYYFCFVLGKAITRHVRELSSAGAACATLPYAMQIPLLRFPPAPVFFHRVGREWGRSGRRMSGSTGNCWPGGQTRRPPQAEFKAAADGREPRPPPRGPPAVPKSVAAAHLGTAATGWRPRPACGAAAVRREAGLPSAAITPAPSESCLYPSGGRALRRFPGGGWSSGRRRKGAARARRVGPVTSGEAAGRPRRAAAARQDGTWRGERGAPRRLKWDGCCRMARKGVPAPCRGFLVPYADTSLLNKVTLGSEWTSVRN